MLTQLINLLCLRYLTFARNWNDQLDSAEHEFKFKAASGARYSLELLWHAISSFNDLPMSMPVTFGANPTRLYQESVVANLCRSCT